MNLQCIRQRNTGRYNNAKQSRLGKKDPKVEVWFKAHRKNTEVDSKCMKEN